MQMRSLLQRVALGAMLGLTAATFAGGTSGVLAQDGTLETVSTQDVADLPLVGEYTEATLLPESIASGVLLDDTGMPVQASDGRTFDPAIGICLPPDVASGRDRQKVEDTSCGEAVLAATIPIEP